MFEDLRELRKTTPHITAYYRSRSIFIGGQWVLPTRKARIYPFAEYWASDCYDSARPGYGKTPAEAFMAMLRHCSYETRRDFLLVSRI